MTDSTSSARTFDRKLLAIIALAAIAVYVNSLWNGFAYDDDWIILQNRRVHQLSDLSLIWGTPYWPSFGAELGLYRPLAIFAYALQWAAADGAPWIYHAVNTTLHALVTALVFLLLRTFVGSWAAAAGALVFAVHPVHTEAVANSVGQAELLAAAGMLGACVLYATRPRAALRSSPVRIGAIILLYFAVLFAKEAAITLPALLVLIDVAQRRLTLSRAEIRGYMAQTWMLFFLLGAAAILYLSIRVDVLGSLSGVDAAPGLPFLREENRILTAFRAWPEFLRLLFFPLDLSADYQPAVILPVESLTPMALLGALILAGTIALALATPWYPQLGFPAAWFMITILTVSNLLFPIGVVLAERTLYTPSVALAAVVAFGWEALPHTRLSSYRRWVTATLCLTLALLSIRTIHRNPVWKDTFALMRSIVRDHPESYRSAWFTADLMGRRGDFERAAYFWEAAMLLWPRDSQLMTEFGNFSLSRRNWPRAIELLEGSRDLHPWVPRTHELLAYAYANAGQPERAIESANQASRLGGGGASLFATRALAYEEQRRFHDAIGAWRAAIRTARRPLWVHGGMLARALARSGDPAAARVVIDSLAQTLAGDTVVAPVLDQLKAAVSGGCYEHDPGPACADPMQGWLINGERIVLQNVPDSQNLSRAPAPAVAARTLPKDTISNYHKTR